MLIKGIILNSEFSSDACASIVLILNTIMRAQKVTFKITQRTKVPVEETQVYVCVLMNLFWPEEPRVAEACSPKLWGTWWQESIIMTKWDKEWKGNYKLETLGSRSRPIIEPPHPTHTHTCQTNTPIPESNPFTMPEQ